MTHLTHSHRMRFTLALLAALAGGFGTLGIAFALLGTIPPAKAAWLWVVSALLLALCLTGARWRSDAPDARNRQRERERRGY